MKKSINRYFIVLLVLVMMLQSFSFAINSEPNNTASVQQFIDKRITGEERSTLAKVLLTLEPQDRKNAVYISENGTIYATSPELKKSVKHYKKFGINEYRDSNNNYISIPSGSESNNNISTYGLLAADNTTTHGPFRRVVSKANLSWLSGYLYLPDSLRSETKSLSVETIYAYVGGTSSTGKEVDAGMQYSQLKNNWSLFLRGPVHYLTIEEANRFKAGQNVFYKFYVSSTDAVTISGTGIISNGTKQTISLTYPGISGWNTSGTGCKVKRVTSIAQKEGYVNPTSGSYVKNVRWYSSLVGTSSFSNHPWSAADVESYTSEPNPTQVVVNWLSASEETVSIFLK